MSAPPGVSKQRSDFGHDVSGKIDTKQNLIPINFRWRDRSCQQLGLTWRGGGGTDFSLVRTTSVCVVKVATTLMSEDLDSIVDPINTFDFVPRHETLER